MPIDGEGFEERTEGELGVDGRTNAAEIRSFLAAHPGHAGTPTEIHEATGVARGYVGVATSRLEERGLVRHREEYWAVAPEAALDPPLNAMATARAATERFGSEDPEVRCSGGESEGNSTHESGSKCTRGRYSVWR